MTAIQKTPIRCFFAILFEANISPKGMNKKINFELHRKPIYVIILVIKVVRSNIENCKNSVKVKDLFLECFKNIF